MPPFHPTRKNRLTKSAALLISILLASLGSLSLVQAQRPWWGEVGAPVPPPALISPSDGESTDDTTPTFRWDNILPVDTFTLQIDTDLNGVPDFSTYE